MFCGFAIPLVWFRRFLRVKRYFQGLPTSEMAILAKSCCRNRDSAVSSSGRLPAPFQGLWACLRAALKKPRLLFGLSEESAESSLGPLFRTPYVLSVFVHMPKRLGAIAFSGITEHMDWSVLYSWILKFRAPRSLQRRDCGLPS